MPEGSFTRVDGHLSSAHLQVGEDAVLLVPEGSSVHGKVLQAHLDDTTECIKTGGQSLKTRGKRDQQRELHLRLSEGMF